MDAFTRLGTLREELYTDSSVAPAAWQTEFRKVTDKLDRARQELDQLRAHFTDSPALQEGVSPPSSSTSSLPKIGSASASASNTQTANKIRRPGSGSEASVASSTGSRKRLVATTHVRSQNM